MILFTIETKGQEISHPDYNISLVEHNNLLKTLFSIHWKPEFSDIFKHQRSLHWTAHKSSAVNSAINQMLSILQDPDAEENKIQ